MTMLVGAHVYLLQNLFFEKKFISQRGQKCQMQLHIQNANFLTGLHSMFTLVDKMLPRAPFTRNNSFVYHQRVTKLLLGAMG